MLPAGDGRHYSDPLSEMTVNPGDPQISRFAPKGPQSAFESVKTFCRRADRRAVGARHRLHSLRGLVSPADIFHNSRASFLLGHHPSGADRPPAARLQC